ncbi:hypothetical protein FBU30_004739 [Linnemannia zychae]|nr:hypothetical protein FBU30_004739 [Linnemannia zychae]
MTKPQVVTSSGSDVKVVVEKTKTSRFLRFTSVFKKTSSSSTKQPPVTSNTTSATAPAVVVVKDTKTPIAIGLSDSPQQSKPIQRPANKSNATPSNISDVTPISQPVVTEPVPKVSRFDAKVFIKNVPKPKPQVEWPEISPRIPTTQQLALCATLLSKETEFDDDFEDDDSLEDNNQKGPDNDILDDSLDNTPDNSPDDTLGDTAVDAPDEWKNAMKQPIKQELIRNTFIDDKSRNSEAIAEIVLLGPVLEKEYYRKLLERLIRDFKDLTFLDTHLLQGLVQVVRAASSDYLKADDLRRILQAVRERLLDTLQQPDEYIYYQTVAVSYILDVMADAKVTGLDRVKEHESLSAVLSELKDNTDPFLLYQASYAFQALQYVPHNETTAAAILRNTQGIIESAIKISAVLKLDFSEFTKGLSNLKDAAISVYETAKTGIEGVRSLIESGQGMLNSLKKGLGSGHRRQWYVMIRQAEVFKRNGRLAELNQLICEAPCRRDPFFQWGICQILGELAADSNWDVERRQQAIDFLITLYKDDTDWGKDPSVKQWTVTILVNLSKLPINKRNTAANITAQRETVKQYAGASLKKLAKSDLKQRFPKSYPLTSYLSLPKSSALLKKVVVDVKFDLDYYRDKILSDSNPFVYVPPMAKASLKSPDNDATPLMPTVMGFLASERQVFLILGDSGSGKSTFNLQLERELWRNYEEQFDFGEEDHPIPLYVNLGTIDRPEQDLVAKILENLKTRKFILICDGYDESKTVSNLYVKNQLNEGEGNWQAKMVISCRSSKLGLSYKTLLMPLPSGTSRSKAADLFQEAVLVPFTPNQIKGYIDQYVLLKKLNQVQWKAQDYNVILEGIPNLRDLVRNPFLLSLVLLAMPKLVGNCFNKKDLVRIKVNRLILYDTVARDWIEEAEMRLLRGNLSEEESSALFSLNAFDFDLRVITYLKDLTTDIFTLHGGNPQITFLNNSFLAERVQQNPNSEQSFKHQLHEVIERSKSDKSASRAAANAISILVKAGVRFNGFDLKGVQIPGADLTNGQFDSAQFQEANLRNVKLVKTWIRQADFSKADMTGAQFGELPHIELLAFARSCSYSPDGMEFAVSLHNGAIEIYDATTWEKTSTLCDPKFASRGDETRVSGDEIHLAYSSKGVYLVSGSESNIFGVWNYGTGELCHHLDGHPGAITSVAVSPDGCQIASTGRDKMVRLWDLQTGQQRHVLAGHIDKTRTVAFSPDGQQVASGDHGGTIRLWDTQKGELKLILDGECYGTVYSVAYSPNSRLIASGHDQGQALLWNAETGDQKHTMEGHSLAAMSVTFLSDNQWVASAGWDSTIRLWDTESGVLCNILTVHTLHTYCVSFSPIKPQLASTGLDKIIRIWELQNLYNIGASNDVTNLIEPLPLVAYSPSGRYVISANRDGIVYQWDELLVDPYPRRNPMEQKVQSMALSPNGLQLASASKSLKDFSIQLSNLNTGDIELSLIGHEDTVDCIFYSSCSRYIATASDGDETVCIWDTQATDSYLIHRFNKHARGIAFSPDSRHIAFGGFNQKLWVYDASSGELKATLKGHTNSISGVAYSPDGLLLASSSWDYTVRLWDTVTNKLVAILQGHANWVNCLTFSTCGRWIVTGSQDMSVRLWDVQLSQLNVSDQNTESTGVCVSVVQPFSGHLTHLIWNPKDAMEFLSSSSEHSIRTWKVIPGQEKNIEKNGKDSTTGAAADIPAVTIRLGWSSESNDLVALGVKSADAIGLSSFNRVLLRQRETVEIQRPIGMDEIV